MDQPNILRAVRHILLSSLAAVLCSAALGCGDDGAGSSEPVAGASGSSGASGASGAGQGGAVASTPPPMPVPCGSGMCYPPSSPLTSLLGGMGLPAGVLPMASACCLDESTGTCGTSAGAGAMCEPRAMPDTRCPAVNLGGLGAAAGGLSGLLGGSSGCCIHDMCGLDGMIFGRGCVENGEAKSMLGAVPLIGTLITVPEPRACDAPTGDDGGVPDAGN